MSNNCLKTTLKGVAQNENLKYLGQFDIYCRGIETKPNLTNVYFPGLTGSMRWESDQDVYSDAAHTINIGKSGVLDSLNYILWFSETNPPHIKVFPMYDITSLNVHVELYGMANLNNLKINSSTLTVEGSCGCPLYGYLEDLDYDIILANSSQYNSVLPLSLNSRGYSKVHCTGTSNVDLRSLETFRPQWAMENIEEDWDVCGILDAEGVPQKLQVLNLVFDKKTIVSDFSRFNYSNCPNLTQFVVHILKDYNGSIVNTFKDNPNMTSINIVNLTKPREEIRPLLDGFKAAGKKNSSVNIYGSRFTLDGVNLPDAVIYFDYDGNGDWTRRS